MSRRSKGFNSPFADLKDALADRVAPPSSADEKQVHRVDDRPRAAAAVEGEDEDALFRAWVGDVKPVAAPRTTRRPPSRGVAEPRLDEDDDAEVLAVLSDLVAGEGTFDIADTDEYVEGLAPGVDRRLLRRLSRGEFSMQAHLDLHGMVREEARLAVQRFVSESRIKGLRSVLIVHGRGRNSPDKEPVLKQAVVRWLSRGGLGKQVLAFATARRHDGGGGALYVLLRR